ncbi:hypothetical protein Poli38472_010072 [Pythium oligandrum]|uniref:C3H1-type domain-containing protein n=1 Tax=Pythium oligandrum TaxID=41045 RepID=A0A8K1FH82_PYTOL|nr:hypothetical protein Poli38472_010072 [Pythium oligandrum]|eukprot:TMW58513.1 hypothetical protein Poli38472_010072 [Pythium oligandrum]
MSDTEHTTPEVPVAPASPKPTPAAASAKKKVLHLVVDSGAIIKGTNLAPLAENFWTVPDVVAEIRDKRARAILDALPFTLQTREPSAEAMKAVANFSRKTGDFASLSLTDLRVMALTYMLETEQNGTDHLKESPEASATITRDANGKIVSGGPQYPCKFFGTAIGCKYGDECKFIHDESVLEANKAEDGAKPKVAIPCKFFNTPEGCKNGDDCQFLHEKEEEEVEMNDDDFDAEAVAAFDQPIPEEIRNADVKSRILSTGFAASSTAGANEDDGKNWINAVNYSNFKASPFGDGKNLETIRHELPVACITTDYSMQNVMLQIGLRLLSTEGMIIKRVKQWILKCIACFTTTTEMERLFCPKCGNSTLERVSYSIGQDGQMVFYHRTNRPVKLTGTKFSLPKPKGGRQGDLLLREDQLMMGIWGQRQRQHKKVMQSAFGENMAHDLGVKAEKNTSIVVGYGRMNPNAQRGRERRGKKKRN